ncbi:Crp/Fnr family transcriptional regulator [Nitrogeniibacter mangrovi]|uniref:Crp/Fnr family transcriptional regulator n=1 Tax=Nitrogeniibacter mangrovi TaxID=2016596 RepID=A0A6C1AYI8_9RHOO|nr:Crp/Fnr family transcriptional regulator [Nitrogeniibacter mangrovi]QID16432.1 Crp/Fnr family transcriptional regulator [Nitrogeniibacter mangrovi]
MTPLIGCPHAVPAQKPCLECCLSEAFTHSTALPDTVRQLADTLHERSFSRGEQLYQEGGVARTVTLVRSGLVKLTQSLPNGNQRIVRLRQDGDIIGLESLVNHHYRHTATAVSEVRACQLPAALIHVLEEFDRQVYDRLMAQWQRNLDEADSFITELSTGTAEARLARLLLKLDGAQGSGRCPKLSREDIGSIIGVSTETASRMMARFKRAGLVREHPTHFGECDTARLHRIADG